MVDTLDPKGKLFLPLSSNMSLYPKSPHQIWALETQGCCTGVSDG